MNIEVGNVVRIKVKNQPSWYKAISLIDNTYVKCITYSDFILKTKKPEIYNLEIKKIVEVAK